MLMPSSTDHQTNFLGTDLLLQLAPHDPLLRLAQVIPDWKLYFLLQFGLVM